MAIQVLAGIPFLASLLGGLFAGLIEFFTKYLTRRVAIVLAVIVAIAALTTAFFAAVASLLNGLAVVLPTSVTGFIGHVVPDNLGACLSVYLAVRALRWAYEWNVKVAQMKLL